MFIFKVLIKRLKGKLSFLIEYIYIIDDICIYFLIKYFKRIREYFKFWLDYNLMFFYVIVNVILILKCCLNYVFRILKR